MSKVTMERHPVGAVKSVAEIADLLAEIAKTGEPMTLYEVLGLGRASYIREVVFDRTSAIDGDFIRSPHLFSFLDVNVGQLNAYNDHFLFQNRKHAENYLAACRSSAAQERAIQDYWEECAALERRLGFGRFL